MVFVPLTSKGTVPKGTKVHVLPFIEQGFKKNRNND